MSSPVTSSHVHVSGIDVLVPFHMKGSSTSLTSSIPSSATSVTSSVIKQAFSSKRASSTESISGMSGMQGLLSSKSLLQATEDEKLVVATLATLDSGSASTLIKQDLKWIIQSRRKAEGKEEIQVEFKKPMKDELTSEEVVKRMRRRELNRLAARRSREKGQRRKEKLVEEIRLLQSQNSELINDLSNLTDQRDNIINTLRQHMPQCSDYAATQTAAARLPRRIQNMLGFLHEPRSSSSSSFVVEDIQTPSTLAISTLYIDTSPSKNTQSPPVSQHTAVTSVSSSSSSYSSCPPSPVVIGLTGTPLLSGLGSSSSFITSPLPESASSSPTKASSQSSVLEGLSRLSHCSVPSFPSPSNSPRKAHSLHHSPWHEESSSPKRKVHQDTITEFTCPASPSDVHPVRFSLERSISCPSSSSKEQLYVDNGSIPPSIVINSAERPSAADSYGLSCSSEGNSSDSRIFLIEQEAPLDLVVRSNSHDVTYSDNDESSHTIMGTLPRRSNMRQGLTRGAGRRWSVDDQHSAHLFEPLNLSTRSSTSHSPKTSLNQPS